ncbi:MAG: tetratricopeptide repeat protein [Verrucomicrobiae bacterium]|nr:tetratricopeptide repeat protein [Verrucomicrobiae bacterium]
MLKPPTPLDLELRFSGIRLEPAAGGALRPAFDVHVVDHSLASPAGMSMSLALPNDVPLGGDLSGSFEDAQKRFAQNAWSEGEALAFGRWLANWLFPSREPEIRQAWENLWRRSQRELRPLRLFLTFPPDLDLSFDPASVPFELLAVEGAFAFRAGGSSVIRTFADLEAESWSWEPGKRFGTVWANTAASAGTLPDDVFEAHVATVRDSAAALGGTALDPCPRASLPALRAYFTDHCPIDVVVCVAHGQPGGGRVWLHDHPNRDHPLDPGEPVSAGDFAAEFRSARVRVAFLWICHGGERNRELDGLAAQLLRNGRVAAVVAAHVPVHAERSVTLARAIFHAAGATARSLEEAVSDARRSLHSSDLQWAAPVYYARPLRGESISFEQRLRQSFEEILERDRDQAFVLAAPDLVPYFRGRNEDLAELIRRMTAHRLVTLTGLPGIGKSELARAAVARLDSDKLLVQRAVWISLQAISSVDAIVARIASELFPDARDLEGPAALFRAMGKLRVLWVLDNAEDLIAADRHGFRQFLAQAFAAVPGLRCLLASRRELGDLEGVTENLLEVDVLPPGHAREVFLAIAGPRLNQDEVESTDLQDLLSLLDGHPRSIVLVAGQAGRSFPIGSLRRRVRERRVDAVVACQMLGEAPPDTPDERRLQRSQRLVASLELAYEALAAASPQAASLFRWLSVFPAGLPSALAVPIFGDEAEEAVALLRRHSMVQVLGGDRRLRLPAPLRWYAHRQWHASPDPDRDGRLIAATKVFAEWLPGHYIANLGQPGRTGIALRTAAEDGQNLDELFAIFAELSADVAPSAWSAADPAIEAWAAIEAFAGRATAALVFVHRWSEESGRCLPGTLKALGDLQVRRDRLEDAEQSYRDALPIYRQIESRLGEANTLRALGDLQVRRDRLQDAEQSYRDALPIYRQIEDRLGEANTLRALGDLQVRRDRLQDAEQSYRDALPIYRQIEARLGEANTLKALGDLQVRRARLQDAEQSYRDALPIYRQIEARLGEANTLQALGELQVRRARLQDAEQSYRDALPIYRQIEARLGEANTLKALGDLQVRTDRLQDAEQSYRDALPIFRQIEDRLGEANTLKALGELQVRTDRLQDAEQSYRDALPIYRQIEARLGEANTLQGIATLTLRQGLFRPAFNRYRQALDLQAAIDDRLGMAGSLGYLARAAAAAGETDRAIVLGVRTWKALAAIEDVFGQGIALHDLATVFAKRDPDLAFAAFYLSWSKWQSIGDPAAGRMSTILAQALPGFDPQHPNPALGASCEVSIAHAAAASQQALDDLGIDPLSPLDEATGNIQTA